MVGNLRFESSLPSPDDLTFTGNYLNGKSGNYLGASLDRCGSFREGSESRMLSSGTSTSRGSAPSMGDLPPLSECLTLDPIKMGDQKYTRSGELRRVLGISSGSTVEDNAFGAARSKPSPPLATEELKRFKASVLDASSKARGRAKKLDESLYKLNSYCDALNSSKQRNEMLTNERSSGNNLLKMGTQIHKIPPELGQRLEDKTKNVVLNKRVRTSVAEIRAEGRSTALPRPPLVTGKNRDMPRDGCEGSDSVEEKVGKLPAGGEGWDKKMKRKRSVGTAFTRPIDTDREIKQATHLKITNDPGLQPCEAQGFRSGSSNSYSGGNKLDATSMSATLIGRDIPKNELEKVSLSRDFTARSNKEGLVAKGNNRLNNREVNLTSPTPVIKGKAARAPRTAHVIVPNLSPNFPCTSGALEGLEQPPRVNKIHSVGGANNRKPPTSTTSSTMAQWVGQRPQKISRTRRTNLISPVSNHDEVQMLSEGCSPSDLGAKITSSGTNESLPARGVANGIQQFRINKRKNSSSPARLLSESDGSGTCDNHGSGMKEKGIASGEEVEEKHAVQNVAPVLRTKKVKLLNKEEIGDGVRRQGRSGRASSFSRASISPIREKLENPTSIKPLKSTRPGSDKNGRLGCPPSKKLSARKAFTCLGNTQTGSFPDFTGESDDDHEELLTAANFACNGSYLACVGLFWKKMEYIFASVNIEDTIYLKQQGGLGDEEKFLSHTLVTGEIERGLLDEIGSKDSARAVDFVEQVQDIGILCGTLGTERGDEVTPLYQRVLSALIVEDETEEFEGNIGERNTTFQCHKDDSPGHSCIRIDVEPRKRDRMEFEYESKSGLQNQKHCNMDRFCCNGTATSFHDQLSNDGFFQGDSGYVHLEMEMFPDLAKNSVNGPLDAPTNGIGISSFDWQYEQMCLEDKLFLELQSVGLYLETVPDLADGEDGAINQDIVELHDGVHKQVAQKKAHLAKIVKAIEEGREMERRTLEQVAMNKLVELSYIKQLATRGSSASKIGVSKVPKQVALAFMKRTLGRCRKFEDSGKSCFSEPALQDVIFAPPPQNTDAESLNYVGLAASMTSQPETLNSRTAPGTSGSFRSRFNDIAKRGSSDAYGILTHASDQALSKTGSLLCRGKKKELLLDDVGGSVSLRVTSSNLLLGGAKGKRSDRERDKDISSRNFVTKNGRPSLGNSRGERKTKAKPKQKTAQLSTSGHGFVSKFTETVLSVCPSASGSREVIPNTSSGNREVGLISRGNVREDLLNPCKEPMDLLDSIEELDAVDALNGHQDLDSWLNIDEDVLQDHDSMGGLDIPMDDLSELQMLL